MNKMYFVYPSGACPSQPSSWLIVKSCLKKPYSGNSVAYNRYRVPYSRYRVPYSGYRVAYSGYRVPYLKVT